MILSACDDIFKRTKCKEVEAFPFVISANNEDLKKKLYPTSSINLLYWPSHQIQ